MGTASNRSGGIQGGITNGEDVVFRVAFKPPATILKDQEKTADFTGQETTLKSKGRHDPCVVPRAVAIVEAMTCLVLADIGLIQESRVASSDGYSRQLQFSSMHAPLLPSVPMGHTTLQYYLHNLFHASRSS